MVPVVITDGDYPMQSSTGTLSVRVCVCDRHGNMELCNTEALTSSAGISTGALVAILLCVVILLSKFCLVHGIRSLILGLISTFQLILIVLTFLFVIFHQKLKRDGLADVSNSCSGAPWHGPLVGACRPGDRGRGPTSGALGNRESRLGAPQQLELSY